MTYEENEEKLNDILIKFDDCFKDNDFGFCFFITIGSDNIVNGITKNVSDDVMLEFIETIIEKMEEENKNFKNKLMQLLFVNEINKKLKNVDVEFLNLIKSVEF